MHDQHQPTQEPMRCSRHSRARWERAPRCERECLLACNWRRLTHMSAPNECVHMRAGYASKHVRVRA
eukprot:3956205-Pleurochrysis_carterae.AAC.2